jgi:SagB-type dehydrogenase family enzyme
MGEICIGGVGLALGYWKDKENTNAHFITHPVTKERLYKTGDLGKYRANGEIIILGRDDGQVKLGGFRVELEEVRSVIQKSGAARDSVVVKSDEHRLSAFIVPKEPFAEVPDPRLIIDHAQRNLFKLQRHGVREMARLPDVQFESRVPDDHYLRRRSFRRFLTQKISFEAFEGLLGMFSGRYFDGFPLPKYLYGSAGSSYPVQLYLSVKPDAVENVEAGYYYYDPSQNGLICLEYAFESEDDVHVRESLSIYRQAAFSLFLVSNLSAITPLYGEDNARLYSLIEAGLITQLLEMKGVDYNIGFCQIGALDFDRLRFRFRLHEEHMYLHTLLGGFVDEETIAAGSLFQEAADAGGETQTERPSAGLSQSDVRQGLDVFLKENLPDYMIPKEITFVETLPLTANGKIDIGQLRHAVSEKNPETPAGPLNTAVSGNSTVRRILDIWKEVLEKDDIDANDNFFEAGGDSFKIIQMHKHFKVAFGQHFEIANLFRYPTIAKQAAFLAQKDMSPVKNQTVKRLELRDRSRRRGK